MWLPVWPCDHVWVPFSTNIWLAFQKLIDVLTVDFRNEKKGAENDSWRVATVLFYAIFTQYGSSIVLGSARPFFQYFLLLLACQSRRF